MIISFFLIIILIIFLYGISFISKFVFVDKSSNLKIGNADIVYGIILLVSFLMLVNFFFPIKYFIVPLFLTGLSLFIYAIKKKIFYLKNLYKNIIALLVLVYIIRDTNEPTARSYLTRYTCAYTCTESYFFFYFFMMRTLKGFSS